MAAILWWQALLLGIIQGVKEWFPLSSSGHLVIAQKLLGLGNLVIYDIVLHLASVISIFIVLGKNIVAIVKGVVYGDEATWNFVIKLIIATIPVGIVSGLFDKTIEETFSSLLIVGIGLLIIGTLIFSLRWPKEKVQDLTYKRAIIIELFEAVSIFPSVSRSGSTTVRSCSSLVRSRRSLLRILLAKDLAISRFIAGLLESSCSSCSACSGNLISLLFTSCCHMKVNHA